MDTIVDLVYDSEKEATDTAGTNVTSIVTMVEDIEEDNKDNNVTGTASLNIL